MKMPKPSARSLAVVSLLMWAGSLALIGFTTHSRGDTWRGYEILAVGWLGIFDSCVAWFANPCLLWAGIAIVRGRRAGGSACLAVLLACDSALLTQITVDEGGHTVPVDAWGWGGVLWALSTALMLTAAGTRARELGPGADKANRAGLLRPLGLTLSVLIAGLAVAAHLYDLRVGNAQERARLNRVAFSRTAVCGVPEPLVTTPLARLDGALEVRLPGGEQTGPWNSPELLLEWGVPQVRYQDRDYSLVTSSEALIVRSVPASGPAAAVLAVSSSGDNLIHLALAEVATGRPLFAQTWTRVSAGAELCPEYSAAPGPSDQPRKVLAQALQLAPSAPAPVMIDFDRYWAIEGKLLAAQVIGRGVDKPGRLANTNCPPTVGWREKKPDGLQLSFAAFQVDQTIFYSHDRFTENVRCEENRVYFYRAWTDSAPGQASPTPGTVQIEARSLPEFRLLWAGKLALEDVQSNTPSRSIEIRSIQSSPAGTAIEFHNVDTGRWTQVNLPDIPARSAQ